MATYKGVRYTTEHINDYEVLVRVYKGRRIVERFTVYDAGDWNTVEDEIERTIDSLEL